jgi:hypothetical protein
MEKEEKEELNEKDEEEDNEYKIKKKYSFGYKRKKDKISFNSKGAFGLVLFENNDEKLFLKVKKKIDNDDSALLFGFCQKNFNIILKEVKDVNEDDNVIKKNKKIKKVAGNNYDYKYRLFIQSCFL